MSEQNIMNLASRLTRPELQKIADTIKAVCRENPDLHFPDEQEKQIEEEEEKNGDCLGQVCRFLSDDAVLEALLLKTCAVIPPDLGSPKDAVLHCLGDPDCLCAGITEPDPAGEKILQMLKRCGIVYPVARSGEVRMHHPASDSRLVIPCDLEERIVRITNDEVFQNRCIYINRIAIYYYASVRLLGVLTLSEFAQVAKKYEEEYQDVLGVHVGNDQREYERCMPGEESQEQSRKQLQGRRRETGYPVIPGGYGKTVFLHPRDMDARRLYRILKMIGALVSRDHYVLDPSFWCEVAKAKEAGKKQPGRTYLRLYRAAQTKPPYLPPLTEFCRYIDRDYMEDTPECEAFRRFLHKKFGPELDKAATERKMGVQEILEVLCEESRKRMGGRNAADWMLAGRDWNAEVMSLLGSYGLYPHSAHEANRLQTKLYYVEASNRTWYYHGFSKKQLNMLVGDASTTREPMYGCKKVSALVKLSESKEEQADVQISHFAHELEDVRKGEKVVYRMEAEKIRWKKEQVFPNDLCPCRSGKRYKDCCWRKWEE